MVLGDEAATQHAVVHAEPDRRRRFERRGTTGRAGALSSP
eukprot:COSAG01_NODE_65236_length_274_cov_0.508571_1_plen_39_part_10